MTKQSTDLIFFLLSSSIICLSATCHKMTTEKASPKITFDLDQIGEDGLGNHPGSKVAIDYEYCIPADEQHAALVRKIDPSLKIMKRSRGRIGCNENQWLCMGNTHQENWRKILLKLAEEEFVQQIDRTFFE